MQSRLNSTYCKPLSAFIRMNPRSKHQLAEELVNLHGSPSLETYLIPCSSSASTELFSMLSVHLSRWQKWLDSKNHELVEHCVD